VAAGAVAGAGALAGAVAGDVAGADAGAGDVAAVVAGEDDPASGSVTVVAADAADVDPWPLADVLADDVPEDHTMLTTRTPTPSAAPLSSVTSGMFSFMPSSTQSR
jgi:hypothetical protein